MLVIGESEHPVTVAVTATNKPLNRFANITVCKLYMKWNSISEEGYPYGWAKIQKFCVVCDYRILSK